MIGTLQALLIILVSNITSKTSGNTAFTGDTAPRADWSRRHACNIEIAAATSVQPPRSQRFTLDGSSVLEGKLAACCDRVRAEVCALVPTSKLKGLLLGGGYGRGEGGVLRSETGDLPYNDLEFYVFMSGNALLAERKYRTALHQLGQRLSSTAGVEVEFKVHTLDKLRRSAPSMFYYDLIMGHRWLIGDDSMLSDCQHHRSATEIPLYESTRLLMNRCAGLLFSAERLRRERFAADDADFVGRNLAKAQLAFGDVILTASGQYHWSCRIRHQRLLKLPSFPNQPWLEAVRQHHAEGVEFKLHPSRSLSNREALARQHMSLTALAAQLWLWLEQCRLETSFASPLAYALSPLDKCAETAPVRNFFVNARTFGIKAAIAPRGVHYPRQRLFHALCLLLWEKDIFSKPELLLRAQRELNTPADHFTPLVAAFEQLWQRFN